MRLDLYLKISRLVARRTLAQELCAAGRIIVNGATAKAAREIKPGDTLVIRRAQSETTARVLNVPAQKQLSRDAAAGLYEIIGEKLLTEEF